MIVLTFKRIAQASKVPNEIMPINKDLVRTGTFNVDDLDRIIRRSVDIPCFYLTGVLIHFILFRTLPQQIKPISWLCVTITSPLPRLRLPPIRHTSTSPHMVHAQVCTRQLPTVPRSPLTVSWRYSNGCSLFMAHCILSPLFYSSERRSWKTQLRC